MTKGNLRLVSPRAVIGTLPPRRKPNAELRTREYLTEAEVERLIKAAKANRYGQRDATMILLAFRQWAAGGGISGLALGSSGPGAQCMFACARVKNGMPSVHPLQGDEMRALRALGRESSFVFTSERGTPFSKAGFAKMVARLGQEAGFKFGVHPHMLRHACGYALANRGHDTRALQAYLGHKNIQHTVRYTELSPTRFKDFWRVDGASRAIVGWPVVPHKAAWVTQMTGGR